MRRLDSSIVILIIIIAIVMAVGVLLVRSMLLGRGETAVETTPGALPPPNTVVVEGETITLVVDPGQRPLIIPDTPVPQPQPEAVQSEAPTPEAQAQPAVAPAVEAAQPQAATGGVPADHVMFISYPVQPNDTLFSIQAAQITSIALMAKHGIDATDIVPGNTLNLPVGNPAACGDWRPYVVLQGDTVFSLCNQFGGTAAEIQARNNLDANYSLYETQVICVP